MSTTYYCLMDIFTCHLFDYSEDYSSIYDLMHYFMSYSAYDDCWFSILRVDLDFSFSNSAELRDFLQNKCKEAIILD